MTPQPPPTPPVMTPVVSTDQPVTQRLEGGPVLVTLADHNRPTFRFLVRLTPLREALAPEEAPLLHLLMTLMRDAIQEGTPGRSVGGILDLPVRTTAQWDGLSLLVRMEGTTQALEAALARLGEGLARPVLTPEGLERLRSRHRVLPTPTLERLAADLAVRAGSLCQQPLQLPSELQLDRVRIQDLRSLHARCLGPRTVACYLLGDVDARQAKELLDRAFKNWVAPSHPPETVPSRGETCGRLWVCGSALEVPEVRLGLCLRGDGGTDAAATHLLPFLFRRVARQAPIPHSHELDPATGFCRLRAAVPAGKAPLTYLAEVEAWLAALAAKPLTTGDLQEAKTAWKAWQVALVLHPGERLAWLASGVYPDGAMAARVEALGLEAVEKAWKVRLAPSGRQTLVLGVDEKALQTRTGAGGPAPEVIRVKR